MSTESKNSSILASSSTVNKVNYLFDQLVLDKACTEEQITKLCKQNNIKGTKYTVDKRVISVKKLDSLMNQLINDKFCTEDRVKELCKNSKLKGTQFSEEKKSEPKAWSLFIKEYAAEWKSKNGDTKVDTKARSEAWKAAKANPESKYYVKPKEAKSNPYEGLALGSEVPDMPDHIMGHTKPVKKDGAAGKKILEELKKKDSDEVISVSGSESESASESESESE
jgi:hypothetical protein